MFGFLAGGVAGQTERAWVEEAAKGAEDLLVDPSVSSWDLKTMKIRE